MASNPLFCVRRRVCDSSSAFNESEFYFDKILLGVGDIGSSSRPTQLIQKEKCIFLSIGTSIRTSVSYFCNHTVYQKYQTTICVAKDINTINMRYTKLKVKTTFIQKKSLAITH